MVGKTRNQSLFFLILILSLLSLNVVAKDADLTLSCELNLQCLEEEVDETLKIVQGLQQINDDPLYDCEIALNGIGIDSKEKITIINEKGKEKVVKTKKLEKEIFKFEEKDLNKLFKYKCGDASDEFILSDFLVRNESGNQIYSSLYKEGVPETGYEFWVVNGKFGADLENKSIATRSYRFWTDDYTTEISSNGRVAFVRGDTHSIVNDVDICSQTSEIYGDYLDVDGNTLTGWHTVGADCERRVWKELLYAETITDEKGNYTVNHYRSFAEIQFFGNETDPTFNIGPAGSNLFLENARWEPKNYTHASIINGSVTGYWNAENDQNTTGGTVYDWTNNDNDGILNGNAYIGEGMVGQHAFIFDGTTDYIEVPDDDSLVIGDGDWSMATWVYVNSVDNYEAIITNGNWNSGQDNLQFVAHASGNRYWLLASTGSGWWINLESSLNSLIQNQWQHIAVTIDRDGAQKIYIDGVEDSSQSISNTNFLDNSLTWNFGNGRTSTTGDLDGKLDEIIFFNKSLASGEVSAIYNNQSSKFAQSSNTSLKSFKNPASSDNRAQITFLDSYIPSGTSATANVGGWWEDLGYTSPANNDVAAHYPLDHNFDAYKGSSNGTLTSTTNVAGEFAGAIDFDGSTSFGYADISDGSINFGDGTNDEPFSVSFWYNSTSSQAANLVGNFYKSGSNNGIYPSWGVLFQGGPGELEFWLCDAGSICLERQLDSSQFAPHDGLLHNVVWTYDGRGGVNADDGLKVFIDAVEYTTAPDFTHPSYVAMSNLGGDFYIGRRKDGANDYNGYLDDIIIFNKTLSQEEISETYVQGLLNLDYQGSAKPITNSVATDISYNSSAEKLVPLITYDTGTYQFSSPWVDMSLVNTTLYTASAPPVPEVTNLNENPTSPTTYAPGQNYTFTATVTSLSTIANVTLYINGVNHTATNTSSIYEVVLNNLSAGSYPYTWYALDDLGGINDSENGTYVIDKASRTLQLLLNGLDANISVINGSDVNITGSLTGGELENQNLSIYVNNTLYQTEPQTTITNITSFVLGTWQINLTIPETTNYFSSTAVKIISVKQASIINTTVDGRNGPIYRNRNSTFEIITERLVPATGVVFNKVNGTLLNSGSSPLSLNYNFVYSGVYNVTGSNSESATHFAGSDTVLVYIIDDDDNPSVVPISPNNESYGVYSTVVISANITDLFDIDSANISVKNPLNQTTNYALQNTVGNIYSVNYDTSTGPIGQYTITFYANDTSGRINDSEVAYFVVNESAPTVTEAMLIATDDPSNSTDANLTLSYNSSDLQNDSIYYSTDYRKGGVSNNLMYLSFDDHISSNVVLDLSSLENNATMINGYNVVEGIIGNAIQLNGLNQSIDISSAFADLSLTNGTLNMWINPDQPLDTNLNKDITLFSQWHKYQLYYISSGELVFRTGDDYTYYSTNISDNQWTQLSAVYSYETGSKYHKVFINGNLVAESNLSGTSAQFFSNTLYMGVKYDNNGFTEYFNGSIDNVRLYNYTLSDEQISSMFTQENLSNQGYTTVVSQETTVGDIWSACVTGSDGKLSDELCSNTVEINDFIPVVLVNDLIESPTDPATYAEGQQYTFNATVNSTLVTDTVLLTFDGINFSASGANGKYAVTIQNLSAGIYTYTWFANDTLGNVNNTQGGTYTINQATTSLNINLSPYHSVTHGTETTATGEGCPTQLTCTLYRDGTPVSNPDVQTLSKGTYTYVYNTTGNENYTSDLVTSILTITQGNPPDVTNLQEYPVDPATYIPNATYLMSATVSHGTPIDTVYLTFNGINYSTTNVNSNYTATITDLAAGTYSYLWFANNTNGAENHSESGTYTVNQGTGQCNITSNSPVTYPASVTVNAECNPSGLSLYRNGTLVTGENGVPTQLDAGDYEYLVNVTANQNYTGATNSTIITVNQKTPILSIIASPGFSVINQTQTTVTGNGCPTELSCILYRDGTPVSNPDIQTLAVGNHTYTYNTTGNNNYFSDTTSAILEVTPTPSQALTLTVQDVGEDYARFGWQYAQGNVVIELSTDNTTWMKINSTVFNGDVDQAANAGIARELQKKMTYYVRSTDSDLVYSYTSFKTTGETNLVGIILGLIAIGFIFGLFAFFSTGMALKVLGYGVAFIEASMVAFVMYLQEINQSLSSILRVNFYVVLLLVFAIGMVALINFTLRLINVDDNSISEEIKWRDR